MNMKCYFGYREPKVWPVLWFHPGTFWFRYQKCWSQSNIQKDFHEPRRQSRLEWGTHPFLIILQRSLYLYAWICSPTLMLPHFLQLFGYFQSASEEHEEVAVGEEVSIFTVSKRRRVGEAAGACALRLLIKLSFSFNLSISWYFGQRKGWWKIDLLFLSLKTYFWYVLHIVRICILNTFLESETVYIIAVMQILSFSLGVGGG